MASSADKRLLLAAALLGLLLGALLLSFWVATKNFAIANPQQTPRMNEVLAPIEGDEARVMAARWFASESNRALFQLLGPLQLVCAAGALLCAWASVAGRRRAGLLRGFLGAILALAIAMAPVVPIMVSKGRAIDFLSRAHGDPPAVHAFKLWHGIYMAADAALLLCTLAALVLLVLAPIDPPPSNAPGEHA